VIEVRSGRVGGRGVRPGGELTVLNRRAVVGLVVSVLTIAGVLVPATASAATPPRGSFDGVSRAADGSQAVVWGWTLDPDAPGASTEVHLYVNATGSARRADGYRPDVNAALGVSGQHGFTESVPLRSGSNQVCAWAISLTGGGNTLLGCRTLAGPAAAAGSLDQATRSADRSQVTVDGWTLDPNAPGTSTPVHVYVNGTGYARTADQPRPDVNAALGATGRHGFSETVPLRPGSNQVCVYAISTTGGDNTLLTCRAVDGPARATGSLDGATQSADGWRVTVSGWTLDPNAPGTSTNVSIHVGSTNYVRTAGQPRPDVNAALGVTGQHGFSETVPLKVGVNHVCVFANSTTRAGDTLIGCRTIERTS
jgi:hypothetical protein